jgi:hypothetical protein
MFRKNFVKFEANVDSAVKAAQIQQPEAAPVGNTWLGPTPLLPGLLLNLTSPVLPS